MTLVFPAAAYGGLVMTVYRRILLVVDLTEGSVAIGRKAQALVKLRGYVYDARAKRPFAVTARRTASTPRVRARLIS